MDHVFVFVFQSVNGGRCWSHRVHGRGVPKRDSLSWWGLEGRLRTLYWCGEEKRRFDMQIMCRAKTNITHTKTKINTRPIIPSKKCRWMLPKLTLFLDFDAGCFPLSSLPFSPDAYDGGIIYCNLWDGKMNLCLCLTEVLWCTEWREEP